MTAAAAGGKPLAATRIMDFAAISSTPAPTADPTDPTEAHDGDGVVGFCDGVKGGEAYGWAWRPTRPDQPVPVELWVDGALAGETVATLYRPDIRAAGMGHGRYGWRLPLPTPAADERLQVVVRVKDGEPLPGGVLEMGADRSDDALEAAEFEAFVAAVLGSGPPAQPAGPEPPKPVHFLLHTPAASAALGAAEYSYGFVLRAFEPLLRKMGRVHRVEDPVAQADAIHAEALSRGETSLMLSFAPPHRTVLGLRCPVVPVVAWEFPTIPDRVWDGDRRHDWRFVLRQTGRAITLSSFAAQAVRAAMGADFPVAVVPSPVFDRRTASAAAAGDALRVVETDGFVLDSRAHAFPLQAAIPEPPPPESGLASSAVLEGVVFTTVLAPKDGRKNWPDIVTAFIAAHADSPDATLVLKMITTEPAHWWWEMHELLGRAPPFRCRILVVHGYMSDARYDALVRASDWAVNASRAEGQCLPLLEFMSAGVPAVTPDHTAMADYVDAEGALVVASDEEYCGWPHDPLNVMTTTRRRVAWPSLVAAFAKAYRIRTEDPARHAAMGEAARRRVEAFCGDAAVEARLRSFLGMAGQDKAGASPSALLADASA